MDIEDFSYFMWIMCRIILVVLIALGLSTIIKDINKSNNTNEKCICEKIEG